VREQHFRRFTPMLMPGLHVAETWEVFGALLTELTSLCDKFLAISRSTKADARAESVAAADWGRITVFAVAA
jgi:hypothetical protein